MRIKFSAKFVRLTSTSVQFIHVFIRIQVARPGYLYPTTYIWCKCSLSLRGSGKTLLYAFCAVSIMMYIRPVLHQLTRLDAVLISSVERVLLMFYKIIVSSFRAVERLIQHIFFLLFTDVGTLFDTNVALLLSAV